MNPSDAGKTPGRKKREPHPDPLKVALVLSPEEEEIERELQDRISVALSPLKIKQIADPYAGLLVSSLDAEPSSANVQGVAVLQEKSRRESSATAVPEWTGGSVAGYQRTGGCRPVSGWRSNSTEPLVHVPETGASDLHRGASKQDDPRVEADGSEFEIGSGIGNSKVHCEYEPSGRNQAA